MRIRSLSRCGALSAGVRESSGAMARHGFALVRVLLPALTAKLCDLRHRHRLDLCNYRDAEIDLQRDEQVPDLQKVQFLQHCGLI